MPAIDIQIERIGMPRPLAVVNTVLLGLVVLGLVWLVVWVSVVQLTANAGAYNEQFSTLVESLEQRLPLDKLGVTEDEPLLQLSRETTKGLLGRTASAIMSILSNGLLVVVFIIFMLAGASKPTAPGGFRAEVNNRIKRYLGTKVLVSATTGVFVGATLSLLDVDMALVFGLFAFLLNFIPNIGSVIATLLPLPVVLLSPELSTIQKILAFAIPGAIQFSIGNVVEPKLMGQSLDLHPVVVLLGLIFFGMIWGIIGMILATPIVAVLRIVLERIEVTQPVARVLAGKLE